jgi:hypothetical protein
MHGGKSLSGPDSPLFKSGRYSRHLPKHLAAAYETAMHDPELVSQRAELALLDARTAELLERLDMDALPDWSELEDAWNQVKSAGEWTAKRVAEARMDDLLERGTVQPQQWKELYEVINLRRRVATSEMRRLQLLNQTISAEQAMTLVRLLIDAVRRNITDPKQLQAIQDDLRPVLEARRMGRTEVPE